MALYVENLYQEMVRQFNTETDDTRFLDTFIVALNSVLDELSFAAGLSTAIVHKTRVDQSISELDDEHSAIVLAGLAATIARFGNEHAQGVDAFDRLEGTWRRHRNNFQVMKSWEDQETQDDDGVPTSDIAGLGYLGDG